MAVRLSRAEQVERNRAELLSAAREVFLAKGYAGATLEAIAIEAGFSKGVVYSQFAGKADLFLALLEERMTVRWEENSALLAESSPARSQLGILELLHRNARRSESDAAWVRLLIEFRAVAARDAKLNERYAALHAQTVERFARLLQLTSERSGEGLPYPPRFVAELVLAIDTGAALERVAEPGALPWPLMDELLIRAFDLRVDPGQLTDQRGTPDDPRVA